MTEAAMFSDWAARMDSVYASYDTFEDFIVAQEAPVYTFDENIVSDLYKDARGFRPSGSFWMMWEEATDRGRQEIWDDLCDDLRRENELLARKEALALSAFEAQIADNIRLGASDRIAAIRWIVESLDMGGYATAEYACYNLGLSYSCANLFDGILQREVA